MALRVVVSGVALACAGVVCPAMAAGGLGSNLIVNGDAELDAGSSSGNVVPVTGFTTTGEFTVVQYNAGGGFPTATDPGPLDRGLNFFGGGPSSGSSSGSQLIDLGFGSSVIDAGAASFKLSAFLGGFASQGDNAVLTVQFEDALHAALGTASIGPVSNVDRGDQTGLLFRESAGLVPVGSRFAAVNLQLTRTAGSYDDGYADNLSLVVTGAVPEPGSLALLLAGLAVAWGARRARAAR